MRIELDRVLEILDRRVAVFRGERPDEMNLPKLSRREGALPMPRRCLASWREFFLLVIQLETQALGNELSPMPSCNALVCRYPRRRCASLQEHLTRQDVE